MVQCGKCRFCYQLRNESWCDYIEDYVCYDSTCEHGEFAQDYSEPQTNADRLRAMTDEELATIIFTGCVCTERFFKTESELLDWMKQEAQNA